MPTYVDIGGGSDVLLFFLVLVERVTNDEGGRGSVPGKVARNQVSLLKVIFGGQIEHEGYYLERC